MIYGRDVSYLSDPSDLFDLSDPSYLFDLSDLFDSMFRLHRIGIVSNLSRLLVRYPTVSLEFRF